MPRRTTRTLTLGKHEATARQLFDLARRLVWGEGPPEELRMPSPPVAVVPHGTTERPRKAWGVAGVGVALEMHRPYPPVEALVIAGYILFGIDWPARFKTLRLPASLEAAYGALEHTLGPKPDPTPVTIPRVAQRRSQGRPRALPAPAVSAIEEARPAPAALPAPTQPLLEPPTPDNPKTEEGDPS